MAEYEGLNLPEPLLKEARTVEQSISGNSVQGVEAFVEASLAQEGVLAARTLEVPDIPDAPTDRLLNLWRELVFRGVSSGTDRIQIEAGRVEADWDPSLHPRGPNGQFVERPWDIPDDILGMETEDVMRELARDDPDFVEKAEGLQVDMDADLLDVAMEELEQQGGQEAPDAGSPPDPSSGGVGVLDSDTAESITDQVRSDVDFQNTVDGSSWPSIDFGESHRLRESLIRAIEESDLEATAEDVDTVYELTADWKDSSYTDQAQTMERALEEALDLPSNHRNDTLDGRDPTAGEVQAAAALTAVTRDFVREHYGESVTARRGIQEWGTATLIRDFLDDPEADSFSASENTVANYTVWDKVANSFSSDDVVLEREVDVDEIAGGPDIVQSGTSSRPHEGEIWIPGGSQDVDPEQVILRDVDEEVRLSEITSTPIEEWGAAEIRVLTDPVRRLLREYTEGDISLTDEQLETLQRIGGRAEQFADDDFESERMEQYVGRFSEVG